MLNISTLKYILEVAKTGSISRAAQNLFVSQPHLSSMMRELEQEMGVVLLKRSSKGVELTDEGKRFLGYAQPIVHQAEALESMYKSDEEDSIKVNISFTRSFQVLSKITNFINKNKGKSQITIRLKETNPFTVIDDVQSKEADFGMIHYFDMQEEKYLKDLKQRSISYKPWYDREFLLAMSEDNPLSKEKKITPDMLRDQITVLYGDYEAPWISYESVLQMTDIIMSKKRIYAYDRGGAMDILSCCPDTYMWISGLNDRTLAQYRLVMKRCEAVRVRNKGVIIYLDNVTMSDECREIMKAVNRIDWTEDVSD